MLLYPEYIRLLRISAGLHAFYGDCRECDFCHGQVSTNKKQFIHEDRDRKILLKILFEGAKNIKLLFIEWNIAPFITLLFWNKFKIKEFGRTMEGICNIPAPLLLFSLFMSPPTQAHAHTHFTIYIFRTMGTMLHLTRHFNPSASVWIS